MNGDWSYRGVPLNGPTITVHASGQSAYLAEDAVSAKHRAPQPKRSHRTAERSAVNALEKRVRRIERNCAKDAAHIATHVARVEIEAHEGACHRSLAPVVSGRTIRPGKSSKPEGPRAQKET